MPLRHLSLAWSLLFLSPFLATAQTNDPAVSFEIGTETFPLDPTMVERADLRCKSSGDCVMSILFEPNAAEQLSQFISPHVGQKIQMVLDDQLVLPPVPILEIITGRHYSLGVTNRSLGEALCRYLNQK